VELKSGPKLRLQLFSRAIFKQDRFYPEKQRLSTNTPTHNSPKMPACLPKTSAWCQHVQTHAGWGGAERTRLAENSEKSRNKTPLGLLWAKQCRSSSPRAYASFFPSTTSPSNLRSWYWERLGKPQRKAKELLSGPTSRASRRTRAKHGPGTAQRGLGTSALGPAVPSKDVRV